MKRINVIGGGLAGCECAYSLLKSGYEVYLYEMRPVVNTDVHKTDNLCELVCSNSLKSIDPNTSQGLLKLEMEKLDSLVIKCAKKTSVPAGGALAVDRELFSKAVEDELNSFDKLHIIREEVSDLEKEEFKDAINILATGPLTSESMCEYIQKVTNVTQLNFYDAVAPIIEYESINKEKSFFGGRYNKGGDDYINCPMNEEEYINFYNNLVEAECVILKDFENKDIFNACMPIEVMAKKGIDTMRFGPLRPVGFRYPNSEKRPYAIVQLRKEDNYNHLYNLVGFQTNLKFKEQERVFRMIPALENAEFVRYGVMHKNIFIDSTKLLNIDFSLNTLKNTYVIGQLSGVEGYIESAMCGIICGINIDRQIRGKKSIIPNEYTAIGSLIKYITTPNSSFQPMHASFSLIPELDEKVKDKKLRKELKSKRAIENIDNYLELLEKE
ncbi:MAG: methylenetetrahydrofolate--tRNA-(uracil(54)-C(5))-methyltransferase (FADH(2)-oxidizing) TrmFO [Clostridia bacterium]|nr:methylenetetrahydrofolate--tRNA-(uracil(54)-C(5))-methyltransferase (FADH(2)-oxidizing) TrmFO [Clostridia bacterium]